MSFSPTIACVSLNLNGNYPATVESEGKLWDDCPAFLGGGDGQTNTAVTDFTWLLQYSLWLGKNGIHDYVRVNDDVEVQQVNNGKLKSRNDQLFAEIDDLNGGQEAIEERARNELGMIKPGETFYRLVPDNKRAPGSNLSQNNSNP